MASDEERRLAKLEQVLKDTQGEDPRTQAQSVSVLMTEPSQAAADRLWMVLVVGLLLILGLALIGLVVLILEGKGEDVLVTVFTATLTGLLGLFVKSPVGEGGEDG